MAREPGVGGEEIGESVYYMKGDWVVTTGKFKLNLHGIFTRDLF
jgi:hypothetical protein